MEEQKQSTVPQGGQSDVEQNKPLAIIGYIISILFFVPLVTDAKNSKFAKFHANQQLDLLLFWIASWIIASILSVIFIMTLILIPLIPILWLIYWIAGLVFIILGVVSAAKGEMKRLPIIGKYELIK